MGSCGQACPYNTLNGCKVKEYNGICPLANMALADMEAVKAAKPQTNADRIRAMSDEELATFLSEWAERCLAWYGEYGETLDWLRQPVKEVSVE